MNSRNLRPRSIALPTAVVLLVLALTGATAALAESAPTAVTVAPAAWATPGPDSAETTERQKIVDRALAALTTPKRFRLERGGTVYLSRPGHPDEDTNYLGKGNSNANMNEYNGFARNPNHRQWCGFFAAAMWGGHGLPVDPGSSRAWRTGTGHRWHPYAAGRLPRPGDVLMWAGRRPAGHVAVVVGVSGTRVTTVEGNTGYHNDSIARQRYEWTGAGPVLKDRTKVIQGFASRF
ncbi:CHAP domain-containing protein [Streptomyces sp. URMC 124]|uniref:CHAP domain-containing protein n=1 Tax=Streptomyces sp. URMC 124 TaxID=3423405 RepID=UPI003F19B18D